MSKRIIWFVLSALISMLAISAFSQLCGCGKSSAADNPPEKFEPQTDQEKEMFKKAERLKALKKQIKEQTAKLARASEKLSSVEKELPEFRERLKKEESFLTEAKEALKKGGSDHENVTVAKGVYGLQELREKIPEGVCALLKLRRQVKEREKEVSASRTVKKALENKIKKLKQEYLDILQQMDIFNPGTASELIEGEEPGRRK